MINITGLWIKDGKDGKKFMVGPWGNVSIFVFKNENKKGENSPDYFLSIAEKPKKEEAKQDTSKTDNIPF